MDALATLVPPDEQQAVYTRAARLEQDVAGMAGVDAGTVRRVCFVVAAIAPQLAYPQLHLLARYALWSILLDDHLDDQGASPFALRALAEMVVDTLAGVRPADPLASALADIYHDLAVHDGVGGTLVRFATSLQDAVASAVRHALLARDVARGTVPPPDPAAYLATAVRTVNYRSFAYALLIADGAALGRGDLARLDAALWHAAYAVRLGNDLASVARDRDEGTLNILDLRSAAGGSLRSVQVRGQVRRHVGAHDHLLASAPRLPTATVSTLTRCLQRSVELYLHADLR